MNTACSVDQAGTRARASAEKWLLDDEGPCCSSGGQLFGEGPQGMLLACSLAASFTSWPAVLGGGAALSSGMWKQPKQPMEMAFLPLPFDGFP